MQHLKSLEGLYFVVFTARFYAERGDASTLNYM